MLDQPETYKSLFAGGFFGTLTRLILQPEPGWKAWAAQFVVGISAAVFLGGAMGQLVNNAFDLGAQGYMTSAYVIGTAAEQAIKMAQSRLGGSKGTNDGKG